MRLKLKYLAPSELRVDPKNKELFDALNPQELDFLARSIEEHGLINPITITEDYLIIAGEQRYRAAMQIGLEQIPVIVRKPKDELELEEIRLDENLARRSIPTYTLAKCLQRKTEIKLKRNSFCNDYKKSKGEIDIEIASETGYTTTSIQHTRALAKLIDDLGELLNENHFSREAALQMAQMPESDQKWLLSRLSASRLKEVHKDEIKNLKTELTNVRDTNAKLQELIESRDQETDKVIKKRIAAEIKAARDDVAEAKRLADEQVIAIREQYEKRTKELDRKYRDDQRQPISRFLEKAVPLLNTDPADTANNFFLISYDLAEMVCEKAEALSPWLISFAKALRARVRNERRTNLKGVK